MSGFFDGNYIRSVYKRVNAADLSGHTNQATALLVASFPKGVRFLFIDQTLNAELALLFVPPGADPDVATNRLLFLELGQDRVINFDSLPNMGLTIDPGAQLFVYPLTAASTGSFKIVAWA